DGIRYRNVTGVQTCALPISLLMPTKQHGRHWCYSPKNCLHWLTSSIKTPLLLFKKMAGSKPFAVVLGAAMHTSILCAKRNKFQFPWCCLPTDLLVRSEEHTSELQSRFDLVCRHLLEKKRMGSLQEGDKKE